MKTLDDLESALRGSFRAVTDARRMGSFILGFCFIEWMARYYFARRTSAEDYREFVNRFLPQYDANEMYNFLRCGLVHGFTDRGKGYDFREDCPNSHLKITKLKGGAGSRRVLNLLNFQNDLEGAMIELLEVLRTNPEMANRALYHFQTSGMILGSVETE